MNAKPRVLVITGPTASGKSELAVKLAQEYPMEVVCVDSVAVYRGMDIGTAKPSSGVRRRIAHHLIDIRDPAETYSAADFLTDSTTIIFEILNRGKIPCLVGGTMLYLSAIKNGIARLPPADAKVRKAILREASVSGWPAIHKRLAEVDPQSASRINANDPQRLQRALEVYLVTGRSLSEHHERGNRPSPFDLVEIAIIPKRDVLHLKIERRLTAMLEAGFIEEVRGLHSRDDLDSQLPSMKAVGYRQIWSYLDGQISYNDMLEQALISTRRLAKHQCTWLKSWSGLHILERADPRELLKIPLVSTILK